MSSQPAICTKHVAADGLGMSECHIQAPRAAAQWANEHPNRVVAKMICDDRRRIPFHIGRNQA
jgi:hypothetical protein